MVLHEARHLVSCRFGCGENHQLAFARLWFSNISVHDKFLAPVAQQVSLNARRRLCAVAGGRMSIRSEIDEGAYAVAARVEVAYAWHSIAA